jgi:hypothetical protein
MGQGIKRRGAVSGATRIVSDAAAGTQGDTMRASTTRPPGWGGRAAIGIVSRRGMVRQAPGGRLPDAPASWAAASGIRLKLAAFAAGAGAPVSV